MKLFKKKLKKRTKAIIWIAIIVIAVGTYMAMAPEATLTVKATYAENGVVLDYIEDTAVVVSEEISLVYSQANGEIAEILVDVGDNVKMGDVIATVDVEDMDLQIKSLEEKKKSLISVIEEANKGTDEDLIKSSQSAVSLNKTAYDYAKSTHEKNKSLYEDGAISKEILNSSEVAVKLAKDTYLMSVNNLNALKKGTSENVIKGLESDLQSLEYDIERMKKSLDKFEIRANQDGVVLDKLIEEGAMIISGTPVVEIGDLTKLYLESDLLANDIFDLDLGNKIILLDEDSEEIGTGEVRKIYPKAFTKLSDLGIEQKRVKVEFAVNSDVKLKLGYEYDVEVVLHSADGVRVDDSAIFEMNEEDYVFVIDNGIAKLTKIEVGLKGNNYYEVKSGLEEGQIVIDSPETEVEDGIAVTIDEK